MHIFPYSRRPGTPADKMPGQLPNAVKESRSRAAIAVAEEMRKAYADSLAGSVQQVLFEETEGDFATGHAPNYIKVYVSAGDMHNEIRPVRLVKAFRDGMIGELL
jgi:threonylcarbamoyladenosine tRNA methylthiotransferase MtaB